MQHAFVQERATDLVVRRRGWQAASLMAMARILGTVQGKLGRKNFLIELLCDRNLRWRPPQNMARGTEITMMRPYDDHMSKEAPAQSVCPSD
jgi:hypothetical protein